MADAAVTYLLEQVTEVIHGYASLTSDADREFKDLKDDLKKLKAILKELENKPRDDDAIKLIERNIRAVVCEVEDTIDTCMTQASTVAKSTNIISRTARKVKNGSLAEQVKFLKDVKVKQMLDEAIKIRSVQPAEDTTAEDHAMRIKEDQIARPQEKVVGLEDVEEMISGYLSTMLRGMDVISVIGMPGLGKTTLAWKIFNSPKICHDFPIRIWVHASQRFNSRDVFLKIIETFTNEDMSGLHNLELSMKVHVYLKGEKFLLVLDDVWKKEHWDAIKNALPFDNVKGKVMVTSRNMEVGICAQTITHPYCLRFLTGEESWALLQLEVFGAVESCPEQLQRLGYSIANNCGGVPLMLLVLGGILKHQYLTKKTVPLVEKEWTKVTENVNLGLQTVWEKENAISELVELSYKMLPYDLRESFLYLGVFPDGYEIPTWTLTRLWIAEGFVQPRDDKSLEETAEENLEDLINRNLLMVVKRNPMGKVKICRVNDMIRVFCRLKASEQNLFQEISMSEGVVDNTETLANSHRLCVYSDISTFLHAKPTSLRVRSFLCFDKEAVKLNPRYIAAIPNAFELLRILHSKSLIFNQFPQRVVKLVHLRYITLSVDDLKIIPEPISQLWNIQTLEVDTMSHSLVMKANIWSMIRLRHVKTKAAIVLDPTWKGVAGRNLQTLSRVSPECSMEAISRQACNLKTLGVRGKIATLLQDKALKNLSRLEKLKLMNDLQYESASNNRLDYFPGRDHFPSNLRRLTLSNTYLDWKHMATLATIGELEVIKLKANAFEGISWEATDSVFKSLQYLLIANAEVVIWEASETTFPSLRCLAVKNCEQLKEIPICVANHLENLEIEGVRRSVADSAKKIKEKIEEKEEEAQGNGLFGVRFKLNIAPGCERA